MSAADMPEDSVRDGDSGGGDAERERTRYRLPWPSLTNVWRGAFTMSLGFTVCAIAVAESAGAAVAPRWFLGFAVPVLVEWVGEWVVMARRQ